MFPTSLEVLRGYFHDHKKVNMSQKDAAKTVVLEICEVWNKATISISEERNIARKMDSLLKKYRNICRNKNGKSSVQLTRKADFVKSVNLLFEIALHDDLNHDTS